MGSLEISALVVYLVWNIGILGNIGIDGMVNIVIREGNCYNDGMESLNIKRVLV